MLKSGGNINCYLNMKQKICYGYGIKTLLLLLLFLLTNTIIRNNKNNVNQTTTTISKYYFGGDIRGSFPIEGHYTRAYSSLLSMM